MCVLDLLCYVYTHYIECKFYHNASRILYKLDDYFFISFISINTIVYVLCVPFHNNKVSSVIKNQIYDILLMSEAVIVFSNKFYY